MSAQTIIGPISGLGSGVFPSLIFVQGTEQRTLYLDHSPFSVGRKMEKDERFWLATALAALLFIGMPVHWLVNPTRAVLEQLERSEYAELRS